MLASVLVMMMSSQLAALILNAFTTKLRRKALFLEPKQRLHGLIYETALPLCDAREISCTFRNKTSTFFFRICWHTLCLTSARFIFKNFKLDLKKRLFFGYPSSFGIIGTLSTHPKGFKAPGDFGAIAEKDVKILAPCESAKQQTPIAGIQKLEASKKHICLDKN